MVHFVHVNFSIALLIALIFFVGGVSHAGTIKVVKLLHVIFKNNYVCIYNFAHFCFSTLFSFPSFFIPLMKSISSQ